MKDTAAHVTKATERIGRFAEAMKPIERQARIVERQLNRFNHSLRVTKIAEDLWTKANHFATPAWQRPFHRLRWRYFVWRWGP